MRARQSPSATTSLMPTDPPHARRGDKETAGLGVVTKAARVRACVCVCTYVCVHVCVWMCECVCMCVCGRTDFGAEVGGADDVGGAPGAWRARLAGEDGGLRDGGNVPVDMHRDVDLDHVAHHQRGRRVPQRRHVAGQLVDRDARREGQASLHLALVEHLGRLFGAVSHCQIPERRGGVCA
jgi:hypothetical protein